jgi:hypothetical protein
MCPRETSTASHIDTGSLAGARVVLNVRVQDHRLVAQGPAGQEVGIGEVRPARVPGRDRPIVLELDDLLPRPPPR